MLMLTYHGPDSMVQYSSHRCRLQTSYMMTLRQAIRSLTIHSNSVGLNTLEEVARFGSQAAEVLGLAEYT